MLNKRILVLIFLLVFLPLVGCFPSPAPPITENQAPIITSIPITATTVGETYVYNVEATDPDGDTLTYSLITKPTGMTINPATGLIKWTPKSKGNYAVVVKVSDGALDIIQGFTIVVSEPSAPPPVNHAPIITSNPNLASLVGIQYTYTIKATDPDGDTLTYYLVSGPDGMTFDTPNISWTPETTGSYDVTVKVSDGKLSDIQSFTIIVKAVELIGIEVSPDTMRFLLVGEIQPFAVNAIYSDGNTLKITSDCNYEIEYGVVTIDKEEEKITADIIGKDTITITYRPNGLIFTDTIEVAVGPVHNITQDKYYGTIQVAIDDAIPGDTITVAAGTYYGGIGITTDDLAIKSLSGNPLDTIIDPSVNISHCSGVTLSGFTVVNSKHVGLFLNYATDCELSSIIISDVDNPSWDSIGLYLIASTDNSFVDCEISNVTSAGPAQASSAYGIYLQAGCDRNTFTSTKISNIEGKKGTMGILFQNGNSHNTFESTEISNITVLDDATASAIVFYNGSNNQNEFNATTISDVTGGTAVGSTYGIILIEGQENTFSGNDISGLTGGGKVYGLSLRAGAKSNLFDSGSISGTKHGIYLEGDCSDNSIHNTNIVGNTEYGAYSEVETLDATDNWWGSGGTGADAGKPGEGGNNNVSTTVVYIPWLTSPH